MMNMKDKLNEIIESEKLDSNIREIVIEADEKFEGKGTPMLVSITPKTNILELIYKKHSHTDFLSIDYLNNMEKELGLTMYKIKAINIDSMVVYLE